jgi:hypothetical protein
MNYNNTIQAIQNECTYINISYSDSDGDGRITSAVKEKEYLDALDRGLRAKYPEIQIERPKDRWWYDVLINRIPINLKLTTGGTDNAFNKVAIIYTMSGQETTKKNMNYNAWYAALKMSHRKLIRCKETEYHYLAVEKSTGQVLLKSILDIHNYKTNPCNILQINWASEFKNRNFAILDTNFHEKERELLKAIQRSIVQSMDSMVDFAKGDIAADFPDTETPKSGEGGEEPSHSTIASDRF